MDYTTVWVTTCWSINLAISKSVHQLGQPARQSPPTMCWSSDGGQVWFQIHFSIISIYFNIFLVYMFRSLVSRRLHFFRLRGLHQESMERTFLSARNWHKDCDQCNFQQVFWVLIKMSSNPFYFDLSWWQNGLMTVPSITLRMLTIRMMMQINANHLYNSEIVRKDGVQCWAWNRIALHPLSFIEFPF